MTPADIQREYDAACENLSESWGTALRERAESRAVQAS
jgi:hypothetical protein